MWLLQVLPIATVEANNEGVLSIQNMQVDFGTRVLFRDLSFSATKKERIALVGHNGAGKSTLLKCIAGMLEPTSGQISKPKDYTIGYLPQDGIHLAGRSVWDEVASTFSQARELEKTIEILSTQLVVEAPESERHAELLEKIGHHELLLEQLEPDRIKPKISSVLQGLGFPQSDFERDCSEFSGGWQMRIALAKIFLQEPDCLLLDEPTNHLDLPSQCWFENYLQNFPGAILVISHDLALLDSLTTRTIAFHRGRAEAYAGNYSFYQKEFAHQQEIRKKQYKAQQREIEKTKNFINRFRAKATKASQVQSRIKQLEKIERIELEDDDSTLEFDFPRPPSSTHTVAILDEVSKSYGTVQVLQPFNFTLTQGQKIAIVGPNGAGKSTFCRLITASEPPTTGTSTLGPKTLPSLFHQNHADELDPNLTVLETVEGLAARESIPKARTLLGCFLFRGDDVFKKVSVLSGGERSRVALLSMLLRPANFLILDEPTNHLDVQSQSVLQNALIHYPGTVLIVSHNRHFLDPIVDRTLELRSDCPPRLFHGNISYYLEKTAELERNHKASLTPLSVQEKSRPQAAQNAKERRRQEAAARQKRKTLLDPLQSSLETLEGSISELETAQKTLLEQLNSPNIAADSQKLQETSSTYQSVSQQLEKAYTDWSQLSEKIEATVASLDC